MSVNYKDILENERNEYGYVIGTVVDNKDMPQGCPGHIPEGTPGKRPTYGAQRCKVAIPAQTDEIDPEDLPWIPLKMPLGTGTDDGVGGFVIPDIGTKVLLKKMNDHYGWIIEGEINSTTKTCGDYHECYPETWGKRDKTGTKTVVNMKTLKAEFKHASGTSCTMERCGRTTWDVKDDLITKVKENCKDTVQGFHKEKIGEYRKSEIGTFFEQTIGSYYEQTIGDSFDCDIATDASWTIGGNVNWDVGGDTFWTIGGVMNCGVGGKIQIISGGEIHLYPSPRVVIHGDVKILGNCLATGNITANGEVKAGSVTLTGHVHPGVESGLSSTQRGVG